MRKKETVLETYYKNKARINSTEELVAQAEKLAAKNGGLLPSQTYLRDYGHRNIYRRKGEEPSAFAHIPQKNRYTPRAVQKPKSDTRPKVTLEEEQSHVDNMVELARQIADNRKDGRLPWIPWLRDNDYTSLANCIVSHRDRFKHFKRALFI